MRETTVSKSIRLEAETVELIEQQEGKNFTDKLQAVLDDYFSGTEAREKEIAFYQERKKELQCRIERYYSLENDLATIRRTVLTSERMCYELLDTIREELNDDS